MSKLRSYPYNHAGGTEIDGTFIANLTIKLLWNMVQMEVVLSDVGDSGK
jgi:hypothetical protein